MHPVIPGSSIHAPIDIDSSDNSYGYASDAESAVTSPPQGSGEFEVNQGEVKSPISLSAIYKPLDSSTVHFFEENERSRVPFADEPTRNGNGQRIPPKEADLNVSPPVQPPNEAFRTPDENVIVPVTDGVFWRSRSKRSAAIGSKDLLANRKSEKSKKWKPHTVAIMYASNAYRGPPIFNKKGKKSGK